MSTYTKKAVKGTVTVFAVSIVAAFLGYLVRFILARNLTVEEFGLFYAVFAFLALISIFKTLGYDRALIKFIPEFEHNKRNDFIKSSIIYISVIQLVTNSIIIILVYLFSSYLSIHFFHSSQADIVLKIMAIAFFIDGFVSILKFIFQGFQKMNLFAFLDLVRMFLIVMIIFIGLKLNYGILSPVVAYLIAPIILLFVFGLIFFNKVFPQFAHSRFIIDKKLFIRISKFSIFIIVGSYAVLILGYTDSIMLTYFSGLAAVGLYNVAMPTAKILLYIPNAFGMVLLPLTSELWAKRKTVLLKAGIESLYKYSMIMVIPLAFIMFSFADLVIGILFGKDYILANIAMKILVIGMIFATIHAVHSNFFQGVGKPQNHAKIIYAAAVFNFIGNLLLIPLLGIVGAAIATTISYFIMMLMGLVLIKKFIMIKFPVKVWAKTLIAGIVFVAVIWLLKKVIFLNVWLETAIVLMLSGIVYILLLFLLKVINIKELKDLYKRIF